MKKICRGRHNNIYWEWLHTYLPEFLIQPNKSFYNCQKEATIVNTIYSESRAPWSGNKEVAEAGVTRSTMAVLATGTNALQDVILAPWMTSHQTPEGHGSTNSTHQNYVAQPKLNLDPIYHNSTALANSALLFRWWTLVNLHHLHWLQCLYDRHYFRKHLEYRPIQIWEIWSSIISRQSNQFRTWN